MRVLEAGPANGARGLEHSPELDGIRGFAILLVLVWHYFVSQLALAAGTPAWWLARAGALTWSGVDLFFVLSGYLLGSILIRHRGGENYYAAFYVRRICRIVPLYLVLLAAYLACALWLRDPANPGHRWLFDRPMPFWSYATFTQNIVMAYAYTSGAHFLGITWSLAVEEQFYLVLPLAVAILPPRVLPWVMGALVVGAPFMRAAVYAGGLDAFVMTLARMDTLLSGVLLASLLQQPRARAWFEARRRFVGWLLAVLFLGVVVVTIDPKILGVFNHTWFAIFFALLIASGLTHRAGAIAACLRARWLCGLGILSFSVYLFHQAVSGLVHAALLRRAPRIDSVESAAVTLLALGVTLGIALLTLRYVERPAIRAGRRLAYGMRAAPQPA